MNIITTDLPLEMTNENYFHTLKDTVSVLEDKKREQEGGGSILEGMLTTPEVRNFQGYMYQAGK